MKSYPKAHFIGMNITTLSYNRSSSRNDYTIAYKVDGGRKLYAFIEKIVTCCTSTCSNQSSSHVGCCQLLLVEPLIEASDKISTDDITDATLPHSFSKVDIHVSNACVNCIMSIYYICFCRQELVAVQVAAVVTKCVYINFKSEQNEYAYVADFPNHFERDL